MGRDQGDTEVGKCALTTGSEQGAASYLSGHHFTVAHICLSDVRVLLCPVLVLFCPVFHFAVSFFQSFLQLLVLSVHLDIVKLQLLLVTDHFVLLFVPRLLLTLETAQDLILLQFLVLQMLTQTLHLLLKDVDVF